MNKVLFYKLFLSVSLISMLFFGCKKNADLDRTISFISINNATLNPLDFYIYPIGTDRPNSVNSSDLQRGATTNYLGVYDGLWNLEATLVDEASSQLIKQQPLTGNEYLSLYVTNTDSLEFLIFKEDPSQRNPDRPIIKFLNLSSDAGELSLDFNLLNQTVKFPAVNYKSSTPYQEFDERSSYEIILKNAKNENLIEAEQSFERGKLYTIWITGLQTSSVVAEQLRMHITEVR